ncbi:DUF3037 domain-containing protein [Chitinophaga oryziterrae]|uniref:DUF3037 domain-containing protein n=1 Tax=Chitinophaga oryziterrae TaxID=1031224 RepID=A0A6N8JE04_9BACT|nr:DUF3037 domain-containing protein [Chitinophaga oryziterrae]MVT43565.1 DUF3037 domain-containing protein [Chitinophaga oryziterrae]
MQENHLFEYAVIRVMPRVEREEFLNIGVILYCKQQRFLQAIYTLDEQRLSAFCGSLDIAVLKEYLHAFDQICIGNKTGTIARLDMASRFRWLTATRSTILQTSKVHPGFTSNPQATLIRLHEQLVL